MQLSKGLKKYTSNTLWLLTERAIQMILTFVVGVMVARYMTEEEYGFFSYAGSLVVIFSIFSNLGLSAVIVKRIVNDENKNL
ncbi:MAG: oligosaccharide flippase family protein, partial [Chitinophagales bacterium]